MSIWIDAILIAVVVDCSVTLVALVAYAIITAIEDWRDDHGG